MGAEQLQPLRQQIEHHLQEELKSRLTAAGVEQMCSTLKWGNHQLQVAVDNAMREAAVSLQDDKIRMAAQRLSSATDVAKLIEMAAQDLVGIVSDTLRPLMVSPADA